MSDGPGRVLLVRHADAGVRGTWPGDDLDRTLSRLGHEQAAKLAVSLDALADGATGAIASSRAVRCVATVAPLAERLGTDVVTEPLLLEGADPAETLAWLESPAAPATACSHGDVLGGVVTLLTERGVASPPTSWPKAGTWVLDRDADGRIVSAWLEQPPSVG